jgi:hypothetical protein
MTPAILLFWTVAVVVGTATGVLAGFFAERLPLRPLFQSLLAAFGASTVAWFGGVAMTFGYLTYLNANGGIGAVGFGMSSDGPLTLGVFVLVIVAAHVLMGRSSERWPRLARHPAVVVGVVVGLFTTWPFAWAMTILQ